MVLYAIRLISSRGEKRNVLVTCDSDVVTTLDINVAINKLDRWRRFYPDNIYKIVKFEEADIYDEFETSLDGCMGE